ncbi:MAG TPA: sigma-70 family RNA polymerase sigma factor [Pyrinomonadaceae bacterium]|nr:sigma-70 family RNA polymerase sigma factor [Pyrinomonadaceae bacterium]
MTPAQHTAALRNDQATLIRSVASGDQHALAALYDSTSRLVYGLVLRILGDAGAAEEVLLDVYTQVWRQANQYSERRGSPLAWLTTIARSRAIDRLRAGRQDEQRERPLDLSVQTATTENLEEAMARREVQTKVRAALDALPPEQREVIELAYYSGMSHSEIAARTGHPLGTVKTRTRLGMSRLRQLLADAPADK